MLGVALEANYAKSMNAATCVEDTFACFRPEHPFFSKVGMTEIESAAALDLAVVLKENLIEWRDKRFAMVDQEVRYLSDKASKVLMMIPDLSNETEFMQSLKMKATGANELAQLHVKMEDAIQTAATARQKLDMVEVGDDLLKDARKLMTTVFGAVLKNALLTVLRNASLKASCKEGEELRSNLDEVVKEMKSQYSYEGLPANIKSDVEDVLQFSLQPIGTRGKHTKEDKVTPQPKVSKDPSDASSKPTPPKRGGGRGARASGGRGTAVGGSGARGRGKPKAK